MGEGEGEVVDNATLSDPASADATTSVDAIPERPPHRKPISYSQPLSVQNTHYFGSTRVSPHRKHSLEDEHSLSYPQFSPPPYFYHHPSLPPHHHSRDSNSMGGSDAITLEMAMSEYGGNPGTLPEITGAGGGEGIFQVPLRAAMHPTRPPALELRPHPLRETQAGSFLRALAANGTQLWAASESGLRMWKLCEKYDTPGGGVRRGDENSAPFYETGRTSPVICLKVDQASGVVWSGHKDGKVRSWKVEVGAEKAPDADPLVCNLGNGGGLHGGYFREGLSWQAHSRAPVLSMVITSYGEIWTGSEGGAIRAWPWDAIQKSLSLSTEEKHMAALLVERSYVDLKNQVTVNGVCPLPASDVKHMVADYSRSKVWTATSLTFAVWDAHTRELLKVFGIDGQVEIRVEAPPSGHDSQSQPPAEDEGKGKVSSSKKEKSGSTFLQRSRNAIMGAADAVRRVATKGTLVEDNRRIGAITVSMDGTIWSGFTNGTIARWDTYGARLQEIQHHFSSVQCFCPFGERLWVGYASGVVQLVDLEGNLLGEWVAHGCPVMDMAIAGSYIFTLAHHGGVRGWHLTSPGPVDDILRNDLMKRELAYTKLENIKIMGGTWNVGQEKANHDSLISWLGTAVSDVGLVVVGLQEVDMGAGFLAISAAKETVGLEGSANGDWWLDSIGRTLDEGTTFQRVGSRQLAGLLIGAWARKNLRPHIGDVDAGAIATGIGRAIGNKGAVGLRMRVYDRVMCFVNSHFAAHLEAVNKRNADFDFIYRNLSFSRPSAGVHGAKVGATAVQLHRAVNTNGANSEQEAMPELAEADMIVFLGDFNYRLHSITYDEAREMVSQRCFDWLRERDQLRVEMKAGKVFQGMREAQIKFPPTYKFQRHVPGLGGYDSGEKKRIPAWCDRILYRDSRSISVAECSLECPVVAAITHYDACMDVTDSDHKPVRCKFQIEIAHADELIKRQKYGDIIESNEEVRSLLEDSRVVPDTTVNTDSITLQNHENAVLKITNKSTSENAAFKIICEGQTSANWDGDLSKLTARSAFGFPFSLEVHPATGVIKRDQTIDVMIRQDSFEKREEFVDGMVQNWWCEDTRDKELILLVNITGKSSTDSSVHRIHVKHCPSLIERNGKLCTSKRGQPNQQQKADAKQSDGSDVPNLCHMRML
ncbi:Endonuclease/exonuclease/phosphatase family protein [Rhynchospora pubera]|uniref:Endonuclease/exonuclease/phosphatase family protein n=1 Tax=Rhynchospora pubera TaxID=906938 RepID=A0AAV8GM03_9POAL|nr:Endonuclease/exonuclease/phosphatase family protein [Rhynchospora pubera]